MKTVIRNDVNRIARSVCSVDVADLAHHYSHDILFHASRSDLKEEGLTADDPTHSYPCQTLSGFSKLTICPGDVIPEATALTFPPCADKNIAADARKSVISLSGIFDSLMKFTFYNENKIEKNVSLL